MKRALILFVFSMLSTISGCSGSGVRVEGVLNKNGAAYKPGPNEQVSIVFSSTGAKSESFTAKFIKETSAFEVPADPRQKMPPGKYEVTVSSVNYSEDLFRGADAGKKTTDLAPLSGIPAMSCEIPATGGKFVVDLDKKVVSKAP
jgi:hypothetical protein